MKRKLFTSGCSYTGFPWPTWADWAGVLYDEYENLGVGGAGNRYIFNSISYLLANEMITKNDTVIIQWSGLTREDRILTGDHGWTVTGNIHYQNIYDERFVNKYFNVLQLSSELISYVTVLDLAFKQIGCEYHFLNMFDYHVENFFGEPACPLSIEQQEEAFEHLYHKHKHKQLSEKHYIKPCIEEFRWDHQEPKQVMKYNTDYPLGPDDHPSSLAHYKYAVEVLSPHLKNVAFPIEKLQEKQYQELATAWRDFYIDAEKVDKAEMEGGRAETGLDWPARPWHQTIDIVDYSVNEEVTKQKVKRRFI